MTIFTLPSNKTLIQTYLPHIFCIVLIFGTDFNCLLLFGTTSVPVPQFMPHLFLHMY